MTAQRRSSSRSRIISNARQPGNTRQEKPEQQGQRARPERAGFADRRRTRALPHRTTDTRTNNPRPVLKPAVLHTNCTKEDEPFENQVVADEPPEKRPPPEPTPRGGPVTNSSSTLKKRLELDRIFREKRNSRSPNAGSGRRSLRLRTSRSHRARAGAQRRDPCCAVAFGSATHTVRQAPRGPRP